MALGLLAPDPKSSKITITSVGECSNDYETD